MLYLDHNATTPIDERVLAAMQPFLKELYGNPSALYRLGRTSRSALENARAQVAQFVGVQPEQVIFTSGGTEANNSALHQADPDFHIVVSAMEHPSILQLALDRQANSQAVTIAGVDAQGLVNADTFNQIAWRAGDFVSIQTANNETGVIQSIPTLAAQLKPHGVIFHTDAVQAAGKLPLDFKALGVQLMSLSSHKIYGPKGCGALVVDSGFPLKPLIQGGGQEQGWRSGTENLASCIGFGKAAELAVNELESRSKQLLNLRTQLELGLKSIPNLVIFSEPADRLVNTVQWGIAGMDGEMLLMQLDRHNIAVSSGSACSSGGGKASAGLTAMGIPEALAKSALRVSLGIQNTATDIEHFLQILKSLVNHRAA